MENDSRWQADEERWQELMCKGRVERLGWSRSIATFVEPGYEPVVDGWDLLRVIEQTRMNSAVVGVEGSGKSHAAWMYEYIRRWEGTRVMVPLKEKDDLSGEGMARRTAQAGVVGYIESFLDTGEELGEREKRKLATLVRWGGKSASEMLMAYLDDEWSGLMGKAWITRWVKMGEVKFVDRSQVLLSAMTDVMDGRVDPYEVKPSVEECVRLLKSMKRLRCEGVELVIDLPSGAGEDMAAEARRILSAGRDWIKQGLVTRWFVGEEWEKELAQSGVSVYKLAWGGQDLKRMLEARFRAMGLRRVSLDEMGFEGLDDEVVAAADGNARKYVGLVEKLVEGYLVSRGMRITRAGWQGVREELK